MDNAKRNKKNLRDPNTFGTWDNKIGFFLGNAGESRGQSPRYLCHVIKSPDDRLREYIISPYAKTACIWGQHQGYDKSSPDIYIPKM